MAIFLGELLLTHSRALFAYWVVWFVAVNILVMGYEEPALRRQFGASYEEYTQRVHRWLPRWPHRNAMLTRASCRSAAGPVCCVIITSSCS